MSVREFWLGNSKGNIFKLTGRSNPVFFHEPSGLGMSMSFDTHKIGTTEVVDDITYNLEPIQGELIFHAGTPEGTYQEYSNFMRFIRHQPLTFYYRPPNTKESYNTQIRVEKIEKKEIDKDTMALRCPIQFRRENLWRKTDATILELENKSTGGGKSYPLVRPSKNFYGQNSLANIPINNNSFCDTPFMIEVIGTCSNLQFGLYDEENELYGICKILGTYEYISINSDDLDEEIILIDGENVVSNPFNMQDLSIAEDGVVMTFLKFKPGKSILKVITDDEFAGKVRITWRDYYVSL